MPKTQVGGVKLCRHVFRVDGARVARCTRTWMEPHKHGKNVAKIVAAGHARYLRTSRS